MIPGTKTTLVTTKMGRKPFTLRILKTQANTKFRLTSTTQAMCEASIIDSTAARMPY